MAFLDLCLRKVYLCILVPLTFIAILQNFKCNDFDWNGFDVQFIYFKPHLQ